MAIAPIYRTFLEIARERGVDLAATLREARLDPAELVDVNGRLSPEQGVALGRALFRRIGDPAIGLTAAARMPLSDLDLIGYLIKHARDLAGAFTAFARYGRLLGDTAAFSVEYRDDEIVVGLSRTGGRKLLPESSDCAVALLVRFVRELTVDQVQPRAIQLPRVAPRDVGTFARFFQVPVTFGAERGAIVYPSAALTSPMLHADPELTRILARQAASELATLPPDADVVVRVRAHLARELEQSTSELADVARSLGMSDRTLRRRLREAGTGYRELLDQVRREQALALADQGEVSVTALGIMTGFRDSAAFARAFRRWTGRAPSDYLLARQRTGESPGSACEAVAEE